MNRHNPPFSSPSLIVHLPSRIAGISIRLFLVTTFFAATSVGEEPTATKTHKHTNRLAKESSPYLLQHAHNPVNWYPWGEEAIAKAQRENKMIFLSVGYAACHWCHVMERESFEDAEIAAAMNEKFVCIKVDREERPDVDQIYMTAVQMVSGNGGWPMSMFLLPDTRPFWGGTYFPARTGDRGTATGFKSIMTQIDQAWQTQPDSVTTQAEHLTKAIRENQKAELFDENDTEKTINLDSALVTRVAGALKRQFDPEFGGFGYTSSQPNSPKFPEPANLIFLQDRMNRKSVPAADRLDARKMLIKSLDGMISGAMIDHLGGGFHRYSVDRKWQIPHFEKMLYDNGQLASVYAAAYEDTGSEEYRRVTEGICNFVLRELRAETSPEGDAAFYAALDADSEGEEGKFYRWTKEEIAELTGSVKGFDEAVKVYRLSGTPNFEHEFFAPDPRRTLTSIAKENGEAFAALDDRLMSIRKTMFDIRAKRPRPITDIKILTAWNGLMIAGMADAGRILKKPKFTTAASGAAEFVLRELADDDGRLKRSYAAGEAKLNAYVDDYAFFASGLIALHRASGDDKWLNLAKKITDKQIELFWDEADGGFYFTSSDHPSLIVRVKDPVDGAIPAGTSVSAENLMYLSKHFPDGEYQAKLKATIIAALPMFRRGPAGIPRMAAVVAEYLDQP